MTLADCFTKLNAPPEIREEILALVEQNGGDEQAAVQSFLEASQNDANDVILQLEKQGAIAESAPGLAEARSRTASETIHREVLAQLESVGEPRETATLQARLVSTFYANNARKAGLDPLSVFRETWRGVSRTLPEILQGVMDDKTGLGLMIDRIRRGEIPTQEQAEGSGTLEQLRERGLKPDPGGELASREINAATKRPGKRNIVRDDGMTLEDAATLLAEQGVLNVDPTRENVEDAVLGVIDQELRGQLVNAPESGDPLAAEMRAELNALKREIEATGIDLENSTNAEVIEALDGLMAGGGELAAQQFEQQVRGQINVFGDRSFEIQLGARSDLSTFLHESAHGFLEVMRRLGEDANATEEIKQEWATILEWLGVENGSQIETAHHERWAESFETYLQNGKAPSSALRDAFRRFASWIRNVYRRLKLSRLPIDDQVKGIFDRLLASDAEIQDASNDVSFAPIFESAEQAGMTDEQFTEYVKSTNEVRERAREKLTAELVQDKLREEQAWWKEEAAQVEQELRRNLDDDRTFRALTMLQRGESPSGKPAPDWVLKLDRKSIVDLAGTEALKRLPGPAPDGTTKANRGPYIYARKDGMHADQAAQLFGFGSGLDLITALIDAKDLDAYVQAEVDRVMTDRYPDRMDPGAIVQESEAAMHNDARGKLLVRELKALANRTGQRLTPAQIIRDRARELIGQRNVLNLRPGEFLRAGERASRKAIEAAASGDNAAALRAQQQRLMNHYLYLAARSKQDELLKAETYFNSFEKDSTRKRIGKAGSDFMEQIDGILGQYEFKNISRRDLERRQSLREWLESKGATFQNEDGGFDITAIGELLGAEIDIPEKILAETQFVNWRTLSVDDVLAIRDTIKQIEHFARLKNKLLKAADKRRISDIANEIRSTLAANHKAKPSPTERDNSFKSRVIKSVGSFFASHRKMSSIAREADGFQDGGPLWEHVIARVNEASDQEVAMNMEANEAIRKIFVEHFGTVNPKGWLKKDVFIKSRGESFSLSGRLAILLNWGNQSNRDRLLSSYKGERQWTTTQVEEVINTLSAEEVKFAQAVWDYIDTFWPASRDQERRVTGRIPDKVEPIPVETKHGTLRGGYYPLKYDSEQSTQQAKHDVTDQAKQAMGGVSARMSSQAGHLKNRAKNVSRPILLDATVWIGHVSDVVHTLSHRETLIDVSRILNAVDDDLRLYLGYNKAREMRDALLDIASGPVGARTPLESLVNHVRKGSSIAAMGWKLSTAMLQPFGLTQSVQRIGLKYVAKGIGRWTRDTASMENTAAWIASVSPFMKERSKTMNREINELQSTIGKRSQLNQNMLNSYFWMIGRMQMIVDIPTWLGAYEKAMDQGIDEKKAIALADQAVIDTQGSGQVKDLAKIQRGGPLLKLWTNFYSFFSVYYNLNAEAFGRFNLTKSENPAAAIGRLGADMLLLTFIPATMSMILNEMIRGTSDDDEDKGLAQRLAEENLMYAMGAFVGVRELTGAISGFDYSGPAGTRVVESLTSLAKQAAQGEADRAFVKAMNESAGMLFHYPSGMVQNAADSIFFDRDGERTVHEFFFGQDRQ